MAQSVARILGKDEVTGSNPVSSSKAPKTLSFRGFFGMTGISMLCGESPLRRSYRRT